MSCPLLRRVAPGLFVLACAVTLRADYSNAVMSLNPVAYWPLSDAPRINVAVNHGSAGPIGDGHYSGSVTSQVAGAIIADDNKAAGFDGSSAALTLPYQSALSLTTFSIEGWFKPAKQFPSCAFSCGAFGARRSGWVIYYNPSNGWTFRLHGNRSTAPSLNIEGGDTEIGRWHHIAAVYDGESGRIYVDGSSAAEAAKANNFTPNQDGPFTIGTRSDTEFSFKGCVDEIAFYTNVLSPAVIQSHYQNGTNLHPSQSYESLIQVERPWIYYRLDEPVSSAQSTGIATNYGSLGTNLNANYTLGPRQCPGPPLPGFGSSNFGCQFYRSVGGHIESANLTALNILGPITVIAWVKPSPAVNLFQAFFGRDDSSWRCNVDQNGVFRWANGNLNRDAVGVTRVDDEAWHFFAGVYDGTSNSLYVDGRREGFSDAPAPVAGAEVITMFGTVQDYRNRRAYQGSLAQVAVFTNALSAVEIQRIYQSARMDPKQREASR